MNVKKKINRQAKIFMYHEHELESQRYIIEQACYFYLQELLPIKQRRMIIHLYFNIKFDDNTSAQVDWIDTNILPNIFEIKFSKKTTKNMLRILKCLAHEMIHIKQFAKGELYDHLYQYTVKWKKIKYKSENECSDEEYMSRPWEIEAFQNEFKLFKKFMIKYELTQKMIRENPDLCVENIRKVLETTNS